MRKLFLLLTAMACLGLVGPACADEDREQYVVRNVKWGMTKEEVINSEKTPPVTNEDDAVGYADTILEEKSLVLYSFENLVLTKVYIRINASSQARQKRVLEMINETLRKKYTLSALVGGISLYDSATTNVTTLPQQKENVYSVDVMYRPQERAKKDADAWEKEKGELKQF